MSYCPRARFKYSPSPYRCSLLNNSNRSNSNSKQLHDILSYFQHPIQVKTITSRSITTIPNINRAPSPNMPISQLTSNTISL